MYRNRIDSGLTRSNIIREAKNSRMGIFVKSHVIFPASRGENKYHNNSIFKNIKVIEYSNEND